MATTITIGGTDVSYQSFRIDIPLSPVGIAPSAVIRTQARESIAANDDVTITIDGTTVFDGATTSAGEKSKTGGRRVEAEHDATSLFGERVDVSETAATDEDVLLAALSAANSGGDFTLNYVGTATSLGNDYDVENREVKQVFRDMMDRTSRVWWVDPAGSTIHVAPLGNRGTWKAIDTQTDKATVLKFNEGSRDSVRNDVTVVGTGAEKVTGTATDATSISTYGRQSEEVNVEYITTSAEAGDMADELLIPEPLASGKLLVGSNVGDVTQPLANYTVDVTDVPKDIDATGLVIEKQTIEQGRATLQIGEGSGVSLSNVNRRAKSRDDLAEGGSVYNTDRISDDAITTPKLVDTAVIEEKLADAAVATAKLENNAVVNGKLSDLAVSETKIQDDSISTPKLKAEAVTASEIAADTITASQIASGTITALEIASDTITAQEIAAGTITALEIATDTLTANQIDTLDLESDEITIGVDGSSLIKFEYNDTFDNLDVNPEGTVRIGLANAIDAIATDSMEILSGLDLTGDAVLGPNSNAFEAVQVQEASDGSTEIIPDTDNTCYVGGSSNAYTEMHAHNFVTASPDPIDGVDCTGLCDVDWYDNPPEPVRQRARDLGDTDDEVPEGRDHTPVELGTMANWLLEACKAQQEVIDTLADRVEALEQAVGGNA